MSVKDPWPWPADTLTDRARRVARSYRDALQQHAPEACEQLDERTRKLGQAWIIPAILTVQPDDLLTRFQAADYCGVKAKTISEWRQRGLVVTPTPDGDRYKVEHLINYQAELRRKRISRAS